MRATTVTLWDRSDMVVPNKEFITTKLVNWTRVDLKVGVSYDTDVEQVRDVLMRMVLTEFAYSAISFELRVFVMYAYGRPVLLDELYRAVFREFRESGIVIAYPQLEVHLSPDESAKPVIEDHSAAGV